MSRMNYNHLGSKIQPEVIGLVHDEVVSLCHKMYASLSGIEIDGIICISLLDTKEQQVVKIHKTLKSVVAGRSSLGKNSAAYPKIASILSAGSPASVLEHLREERPESGTPNFQRDISTLNDLLQASNALIHEEVGTTAQKNKKQVGKRTKRKGKPSKHKANKAKEVEKENSQDKGVSETINEVKPAAENYQTITVKEEPYDPDFDDNADIRPIAMEGQGVADNNSLSHSSNDNERESPENYSSQTDRNEQRNGSESIERSPEPAGYQITSNESDDGAVKTEYTGQDDEYGKALDQSNITTDGHPTMENYRNCDSNENQSTSNITENPNSNVPRNWFPQEANEYDSLSRIVKKSQEAEKHWLYGIAKHQEGQTVPSQESMANEVTRMALLDKYYQKGAMAHKGYPPREVQRQEKDPSGRSWIEMVKDNVTKYQAALMRSVSRKQSEEPAAGSASGLLKSLATPRSSLLSADNLKALLKEPPLHVDRARGTASSKDVDQLSRHVRDKSLTLNTNSSSSDRSRSASASPAPVVKIEIAEDEHEYGQGENKVPDEAQGAEKAPSGKLESRYPALFNQLQQAKKSETPNLDQSDSLVNRLPFISFQELFATASPGGTAPSASDKKQLLELATDTPQQKTGQTKKKSVWKWKKRHVRSKNNEQENHPSSGTSSETSAETTKQMKPLGINMSAKKTSRKRQKGDDSSDTDWTPETSAEAGPGQGDGSNDSLEPGARKKIKTRLSTGEKQRINFAEIENSDIDAEEELIQEDAKEAEEPIELVSAYCKNNCGIRCATFSELKLHEEQCMWQPVEDEGELPEEQDTWQPEDVDLNQPEEQGTWQPDEVESKRPEEQSMWQPAEVGIGGAGGGVGPEGPGASEDFQCTLCGLDFNQEYRWQYHMVKVHGVTVEKTDLFR